MASLSSESGKPIGPLSNLKLFLNNSVSAWIPSDNADSILRWSGTQAARDLTDKLGRELRKSLALSSRYAVTEQEINARFGLTKRIFGKIQELR